MAMKLGQMLVKEGLVTEAQLEETLKSQVIFGGRLGTNLIEMGYLEEEDLTRLLSEQLGLPGVTQEQLASIPPDVIKIIPREIAEKYKVIPLSRDKKRLTLSMLDPTDLSVIDAISFFTGYYIIPMVISELRLVLALEKYYGLKREMRYIKIEGINRGRHTAKSDKGAVKEPEVIDFSLLQEEEEFIDIIDVQEVIESAVEPAKTEPVKIEPVKTEPVKIEPIEIVSIDLEPEVTEPAEKVAVTYTDESVAEELVKAKDREEIANIITAFLGQEFNRVVLFMVKGTVVDGWKALRNNKPIAGFENLRILLDEPSVLKVVNDGKSFYLGPIPDTPGNARMLAGIGGGAPSSALLIPLSIMGRVVAILYVDGGKVLVANRLTDLQKLVGKTGMAFEILILKNKILMT